MGQARRFPRVRKMCSSRSGRRFRFDIHRLSDATTSVRAEVSKPRAITLVKPFFVYMLRCSDGSYYVGHTDELDRRVAQHQAGEIDGYTHQRRPIELVWSQETATREEALASELRIKGWARSKKEALIKGDWQAIQRHAWGT